MKYVPVLVIVFILGVLTGYSLKELVVEEVGGSNLPPELENLVNRFKLVNGATGKVLIEYKVIGYVSGTYQIGGPIYETYILGFEDRPGGPKADQDFLDVILEVKREVGGDTAMVRIVQLGLDPVQVYLDGRFLGSIRPSIEIPVKLVNP